MEIRFTIPGDPMGKERPRFDNKGPYVKTYTPAKTVNYENLVKWCYQAEAMGRKFGDDDMIDVRIYAYYSIPKSVSNKKQNLMKRNILRPTKKPDFDNIGKIVCDSLNKLAYRDDSQIVDSMVRKFYSDKPRVVVRIKTADPIEMED